MAYSSNGGKPSGVDKRKLHEKARNDYKLACEGDAEQWSNETEDLDFQIPERQWSEAARKERSGASGVQGVPVPPRPMMSIPKVEPQIMLIENQESGARLGVQLHPVSEDAEDDTARVLEGIYRSIEEDRDYPAKSARSWAFARAIRAGRGYYEVRTVYDEEGGHPFDQKIVICRIFDGSVVRFDPAAQQPDFSDARFCFKAVWMPKDDYEREFGKTDLSKRASADWGTTQAAEPDWVRNDPEPGFLVLEYHYKKYTEETLVLLKDGSVAVGGVDDYPPGALAYDDDDQPITRKRQKCRVCIAKLDANTVLEHSETDGQYLRIIMVPGKELQPVRGKHYWYGMVRPARDAQMGYNYSVTSLVETAALEPKAPFLIAEGQIKGYEPWWQQANVRNLPYLPYIPKALGDTPVPPPQRMQADTSKMGPSAMLIEQFDRDIQATTSSYDLGWLRNKERSGRAIRALQEQSDAGNSNFVQQEAMAVRNEAKVVLDLIPHVYDRPGRVARIIGEADKVKTVMLNAPYTMGKDGRPMRMNGQAPQMQAPVKHHDLSKGIYSVTISIGRSTQTLRQEAADEMSEVMRAAPQLLPIIGPEYFEKRDFSGALQISKLLRKLRDQQFPFLADDDDGQQTPQQAEAKARAMEAQVQALKSQLMAAVQAIKTDQVKAEAMLKKTAMDSETRLQIERLKTEREVMLKELEASIEAGESGHQHAHERQIEASKQAHEKALGAADSAQELMKALLTAKPDPDDEGMGSDVE